MKDSQNTRSLCEMEMDAVALDGTAPLGRGGPAHSRVPRDEPGSCRAPQAPAVPPLQQITGGAGVDQQEHEAE